MEALRVVPKPQGTGGTQKTGCDDESMLGAGANPPPGRTGEEIDGWAVRSEEEKDLRTPQKGRGKPKNLCSYRTKAWLNPHRRGKVMAPRGITEALPSVKLETGLRTLGRLVRQGKSVNLREYITGSVPKEARRAVNRWKSLEPGPQGLGEIGDASPRRKSFHPATREVGTWPKPLGERRRSLKRRPRPVSVPDAVLA